MQVTDDMVSRFLTWNLPQDFAPDGGVSFKPVNHPNAWPVGTNLLTATQARALLEHVLVVSTLPAGTHTLGSIMLTALETIASMPLEEQDNMMAANMRHVARAAIDCRPEKSR